MRSEIAAESSHHLPSATIPTHATGVVWTDSGYLLNGLAIQVLAIDLQKTIINLDFACDKNVRIFVDHYAAAKYSNRNCTIPCNGGVARLVTSLCKVSRELMNSVRIETRYTINAGITCVDVPLPAAGPESASALTKRASSGPLLKTMPTPAGASRP